MLLSGGGVGLQDELIMGGRSAGPAKARQPAATIFDSAATNARPDAFGGTRVVVGTAGRNANVKQRSKKQGGSGRKRSGR